MPKLTAKATPPASKFQTRRWRRSNSSERLFTANGIMKSCRESDTVISSQLLSGGNSAGSRWQAPSRGQHLSEQRLQGRRRVRSPELRLLSQERPLDRKSVVEGKRV